MMFGRNDDKWCANRDPSKRTTLHLYHPMIQTQVYFLSVINRQDYRHLNSQAKFACSHLRMHPRSWESFPSYQRQSLFHWVKTRQMSLDPSKSSFKLLQREVLRESIDKTRLTQSQGTTKKGNDGWAEEGFPHEWGKRRTTAKCFSVTSSVSTAEDLCKHPFKSSSQWRKLVKIKLCTNAWLNQQLVHVIFFY